VWSRTHPANDVGGDLVDYLDPAPGRHGLALGDVAGKGMGAALLMAKLQATLRALVPDLADMQELGSRLNALLHRDGPSNRFATLFYLEVRPRSGMVRYLNAGHNPAFVVRPGGVEKLAASSTPLGMLPDATYRESRLELQPGDLFLAYSDGVPEAENSAGQEFGMDRLEALVPSLCRLPAAEVGRRVEAAVSRHLGGERPGDDLSLLVVRRVEEGT
jgi:sigma-B regulation protein RsbU (phosphoserine phosphatase)